VPLRNTPSVESATISFVFKIKLHSIGVKQGLEIVGIAKVLHTAFQDPTAEKGDWSAIDIVPVKPFNRFVTLKEIKQHPELQDIGLIKQSRLSVMPVSEDQFHILLNLGETRL
jgi:predicted RNA-binding protein with PUA-like domain